MDNLIAECLQSGNVFAVVGVSQNPAKFGYKVYQDLKKGGLKVYAVNPALDEVDGDRCYHSLSELPERPDVVDVVTPPKVSLRVVEECRKLGIDKVWLQPGAESHDVVCYCERHGIGVVHDACLMVERRR